MIVTDKFVFIHMHKTGGQTLNRIIADCFPGSRVIGYHYPRAELPREYADLPIVGYVRNPWDWYVSWYAFNAHQGMRNPLFTVVSEDGSADFSSTIRNLANLAEESETGQRHRDRLCQLLPDTLQDNRGVGLTKGDIHSLRGEKKGYYTWLVHRMLRPDLGSPTHVGKFEALQDEFIRIMREIGVPEIDRIQQAFADGERSNTSRHSHYSHYFDSRLMELVADKESLIIDRHDYAFEYVGPARQFAENNGRAPPLPAGQFRKLLGRANNYLKLADAIDVSVFARRLSRFTAEEWGASGRERRFDVHRDTQALVLVHFEDHRHERPDQRDLYHDFESDLSPIIRHIARFYQDNGFVVRLIFAKLAAGGSIPEHTDTGYSLLNCHRVHVPIVTNDRVEFLVGGERKNLKTGEFWEINNGGPHAVVNNGQDDRVHLIVDWMPNPHGHAQELVLSPASVGEGESESHTDSLNMIVMEAYQTQRKGNLRRARSLYKQVLDFDPDHVEANNLLGLLCLQTGNASDAIGFITRGLAERPDDAQARANLGLALKDVGRFEDAAKELKRATALQPDNPRTHNNLGNLLCELQRFAEAVESYRRAVQLDPEFPEAHRNLGAALIHVSRIQEGITSLQQAIALRPDFSLAQLDLQEALQLAQNETRIKS